MNVTYNVTYKVADGKVEKTSTQKEIINLEQEIMESERGKMMAEQELLYWQSKLEELNVIKKQLELK